MIKNRLIQWVNNIMTLERARELIDIQVTMGGG